MAKNKKACLMNALDKLNTAFHLKLLTYDERNTVLKALRTGNLSEETENMLAAKRTSFRNTSIIDTILSFFDT